MPTQPPLPPPPPARISPSPSPLPPPPPPRRPPPALRADSSSTYAPSLAPSTASSSKSMRARALVSRLAHSTADYASAAQSAAAPRLSSAKGKLKEAWEGRGAEGGWEGGGDGVLQTPKKALRSRQAQAEYGFSAGGGGSRGGTPPASPSVEKMDGFGGGGGGGVKTPGGEKGAGSSRWGGWGSYFYGSGAAESAEEGAVTGRDGGETGAGTVGGGTGAGTVGGGTGAGGKPPKVGADDVEEDKVVCFPGWATLSPSPSPSPSDPALTLSIYTHGYCYRQRPLSSASRSQRIFYALAKSFAALPKVAAAGGAGVGESVKEAAEIVGAGVRGEGKEGGTGGGIAAAIVEEVTKPDPSSSSSSSGAVEGEGKVFEQLLDIGGREGLPAETTELALATVDVAEGREPRTRTTSGETALSDEPEEMSLEERLRSPTLSSFPPSTSSNKAHNPAHPAHHAATAPPASSSASLPSSPTLPSSTSSSSPEDTLILGPSHPTRLNRRPHVRIDIPKRNGTGTSPSFPSGFTALRSPSLPSSPQTPGPKSPLPKAAAAVAAAFKEKTGRGHGHGMGSGSASKASSAASSRASSRANSPTRLSSRSSTIPPPSSSSTSSSLNPTEIPPESWPTPFPPPSSPTPTLLATYQRNVHSRLLPFLGSKLPSRKVRLTVHPVLPQGRLFDGVLARRVVSTGSPGGGWKERVEVGGRELRGWLEAAGGGELRIRVEAELLEPDAGTSAVDSLGWEAGYGIGGGAGDVPYSGGGGGRMEGWELRAQPTAHDECEVGVGVQGEGGEGGGVRVVSDVDDTIKWTEVVKGTKTIFRNCFVRELHEIRVPGMASWYNHLATHHSAHFHYVSNSPWELYPVIRSFLRIAGFPPGSVTLKEYGGAASTLAKLWEEPGARKRANVEGVMREFPGSKFILVGDSGEQDMQLYCSLAAQYPHQVLAIYIRDVTTPFTPPSASHPSSSSHHPIAHHAASLNVGSLDDKTPTMEKPSAVEWHHSSSAADLASLVREEEQGQEEEERERHEALRRLRNDLEREDEGKTPTLEEVPDLPRPQTHHASTLPNPPFTSSASSAAPPSSNLAYKPYEPKRRGVLHRKTTSNTAPSSSSSLDYSLTSGTSTPPPPVPPRPSLGARALSKSLIEAVGKKTHRDRESRKGSVPSTPSSSRPPSPTFPSGEATPPGSYPSSVASRASSLSTTDPSALYEPFTDPLSPNNPIRPSLPPPPPPTPAQAVVEAFYRRVAEAERMLPRGVKLRIFRHGEECRVESGDVVRRAMQGRR
ncbi:hypothetical protein JCM8547_006398 [Rhodosporidiobolus lusitaniae]